MIFVFLFYIKFVLLKTNPHTYGINVEINSQLSFGGFSRRHCEPERSEGAAIL
jgi:hypothetical protein